MVSDSVKRINSLLDKAEVKIANVFRSAIFALKDEIDLKALADLIEAGDLEQALGLLKDAAEKLGAASTVVFIGAGESTAQFLTGAGVGKINFDAINLRGVRAMRENQLDLIREFIDGQRNTLRAVMTEGIARGLAPIDQARQFRSVVGLTQRQSEYVGSYRALLESVGRADVSAAVQARALERALRDQRSDSVIRSAINRSRALPQKQIDSMVERYYNRWVKHRAETIARTEALSAVHQGVDEAFSQAIDSGVIDQDDLIGTWHSARDNRVRDSHLTLNGQKRKRGQTWAVAGGELRYPGDPLAPAGERIKCRCVVTWQIKANDAYA